MQSFLFYETLLLIDFRVNHRLQLISTLFFLISCMLYIKEKQNTDFYQTSLLCKHDCPPPK